MPLESSRHAAPRTRTRGQRILTTRRAVARCSPLARRTGTILLPADAVATARHAVVPIAVHDPQTSSVRRRLHRAGLSSRADELRRRRKSAKSARASGPETWQMTALEIARRLRRRRPSIGQDDLAYAVSIELPPKLRRAHDTLRRFLASEENAGRLPPQARRSSR